MTAVLSSTYIFSRHSVGSDEKNFFWREKIHERAVCLAFVWPFVWPKKPAFFENRNVPFVRKENRILTKLVRILAKPYEDPN